MWRRLIALGGCATGQTGGAGGMTFFVTGTNPGKGGDQPSCLRAIVPSWLWQGKHKHGSSRVAFDLDDQIKRYKDLVKRTSDLRSYL